MSHDGLHNMCSPQLHYVTLRYGYHHGILHNWAVVSTKILPPPARLIPNIALQCRQKSSLPVSYISCYSGPCSRTPPSADTAQTILVSLSVTGDVAEPGSTLLLKHIDVFEMPRYTDVPHHAWVDLGTLVRAVEGHVVMSSKCRCPFFLLSFCVGLSFSCIP